MKGQVSIHLVQRCQSHSDQTTTRTTPAVALACLLFCLLYCMWQDLKLGLESLTSSAAIRQRIAARPQAHDAALSADELHVRQRHPISYYWTNSASEPTPNNHVIPPSFWFVNGQLELNPIRCDQACMVVPL
eukprot:2395853-Amphidinium_carterae.1